MKKDEKTTNKQTNLLKGNIKQGTSKQKLHKITIITGTARHASTLTAGTSSW
jgi:hypothetical protein